uniref:Uncharacterized protein n=1 Tax=Branchiostoma floridae TaxID=7739 RepID=C3YST8_BRAFL|eukprot:XP_002600590.1 hypothetical protein BRAFLDRAFT_101631 [Branchiostoma floridae]
MQIPSSLIDGRTRLLAARQFCALDAAVASLGVRERKGCFERPGKTLKNCGAGWSILSPAHVGRISPWFYCPARSSTADGPAGNITPPFRNILPSGTSNLSVTPAILTNRPGAAAEPSCVLIDCFSREGFLMQISHSCR